MLANLFRRLLPSGGPVPPSADSLLYDAIVAQARHPEFYLTLGIPDSQEGRFEMISLHSFLVMARLKDDGPVAEALNQTLFDRFFTDMEFSLRESGVSDVRIGKRIKDMAMAFYGRAVAFERDLTDNDPHTLEDTVLRNTYHMTEPNAVQVTAMAGYLRQASAGLAAQKTEQFLAGSVDFGEPPTIGMVHTDDIEEGEGA